MLKRLRGCFELRFLFKGLILSIRVLDVFIIKLSWMLYLRGFYEVLWVF